MSTKLQNCSSFRDLVIRGVTGWGFYCMYGIVVSTGMVLNTILGYSYNQSHSRILGKRTTFNFIMKCLNLTDLSMSVMLFVNIFIVRFAPFNDSAYMVLFISPRNITIGFEVIILTLMALDRFLAAIHPTTQKWNTKKIKIILMVYLLIGSLADFLFSGIITVGIIPCSLKTSLQKFYLFVYGIVCLMLLLTNICTYISLFIYFLWITSKTMKIGSNDFTQEAHKDFKALKSIMKFGRLLFMITCCYTLNLIPIVLANSGLVHNMKFGIYYFFYLNTIINPIIFIIGNESIKKHILRTFICTTI